MYIYTYIHWYVCNYRRTPIIYYLGFYPGGKIMHTTSEQEGGHCCWWTILSSTFRLFLQELIICVVRYCPYMCTHSIIDVLTNGSIVVSQWPLREQLSPRAAKKKQGSRAAHCWSIALLMRWEVTFGVHNPAPIGTISGLSHQPYCFKQLALWRPAGFNSARAGCCRFALD